MEDNTYEINLCRGCEPETCRFAQAADEDLECMLAEAVKKTGWPDFINQTHNWKVKHHNKFRISIAMCPNGCSRPHIADLGIISSAAPGISEADCTGCGLCASRCSDRAIEMTGKGPEIDWSKCLLCGHCADICSSGTIIKKETGLRIVAGGRMGRRPALAVEVPGIHSPSDAARITEKALTLYMKNYSPGSRFRDIIDRNREQFLKEIE